MEELETNRIPLTDGEVASRTFLKIITMNGLPTGDNIARCIRLFPMLAKEAGFGNGEAK